VIEKSKFLLTEPCACSNIPHKVKFFRVRCEDDLSPLFPTGSEASAWLGS